MGYYPENISLLMFSFYEDLQLQNLKTLAFLF